MEPQLKRLQGVRWRVKPWNFHSHDCLYIWARKVHVRY